MFNKKLTALALSLGILLPGAAHADAVISALSATTSLLSTDEIPWCQGCTTSTPATYATVSTLSTYLGSLTQTLTNKTLTTPTIAGGALSGTFSGNFTASGVPILSGLSSGTCSNNVALDSGNHIITTACPAGSGISGMTASQLAVAGTATTITSSAPFGLTGNSTIVETTSGGLLTPSILPLATSAAFGAVKVDGQTINAASGVISVNAPNRTITSTTGDAFVAGDMGGQVNLGSGSTIFTIPAVGSGIWNTGATAVLVNNSGAAITVTNTATVNGACGGATFIFPIGGTCTYTSNGTSVDSAGLSGLATPPVTLTATGNLDARTQCGLPLHYNSSSAGTITILGNAVAAGCNFPVVAVGTGLATIASGGTLVGNSACTTHPRTTGQYSTIWVEILSNAGTAPVVNVSGDCG